MFKTIIFTVLCLCMSTNALARQPLTEGQMIDACAYHMDASIKEIKKTDRLVKWACVEGVDHERHCVDHIKENYKARQIGLQWSILCHQVRDAVVGKQ